jgi:alkaline phosphatase D
MQFKFLFLATLSIVSSCHPADEERVYFTTGFKIGAVTESSVVIQTRLCSTPTPIPITHLRNPAPFRDPIDFDEDMPTNKMDGAVAGAPGEVKIQLVAGKADTLQTAWEPVSADRDYTIKHTFEGLAPNTKYQVILQARRGIGSPTSTIVGQFKTTPTAAQIVPVLFTSSTCQYFWDYDDSVRGFKIYDKMRALKPDFHCQTGDYVYYDKPGPMAYTVAEARHKWNAINAWPSLVDFYAETPLFIQKDDHDIGDDDTTPFSKPFGELTFQEGLKIWYEQTPTVEKKPYRSVRYGRDLEIWFVEGREFRNSDNVESPTSSIWGDTQKLWFTESVTQSDATFKILMSPTPVVGPDREKKKDNHANTTYAVESKWLKDFISTQKNMFIVNGDRHWQYVSKDPETGILEFSQGPSSDEHAQGWSPDDLRPEHEFLRVRGGFLAVDVGRLNSMPSITFTHYDVDGNAVRTKSITIPDPVVF